MSRPSFRVYIDESGEEGFVWHADGTGSSRWLVLAAVVTRREKDLVVVDLMKKVRQMLNRPPKQPLHFREMKHEHRVPYVRDIGNAQLRAVAVMIHKPDIREPEKFQAQKHLLYRYGCKFLLERASWLCRDHRKEGEGDGRAEVIFSNRGQMSYEEIRDYVRRLKSQSNPMNVTIDWNVIDPEDPEMILAVQHEQLAGLQVADAVASGVFFAANPNKFGETEDRYLRLLSPILYRHKGVVHGHGLKFWPNDLEATKRANPHLEVFAQL